jgi:hypothetical protein
MRKPSQRGRILELHAKGLTGEQIRIRLGVTQTTVARALGGEEAIERHREASRLRYHAKRDRHASG